MIENKDKWRLTHILEAIEDIEELTSVNDLPILKRQIGDLLTKMS